MKQRHHALCIDSDGQRLRAELAASESGAAILFVHGWDSDHQHYEDLSDRVAALGATCLTFDLRGHGRSAAMHAQVNRNDNLNDVLAAYDALAGWPGVDGSAIGIVGTSYGGYLAAIATALRPVRWLALRVPALYPDAQWDVPKTALDRQMLQAYRKVPQGPDGNRALAACHAFHGDVLVVESGEDHVVPHPAVQSFVDAFARPRSLTHCTIEGADHALSSAPCQRAYAALVLDWIKARLDQQTVQLVS